MGNRKYNYLAKNTALFTLSSFGSKLLTFLLVPFYTSVLTTNAYGTADLISTTAYLLIYIFTINIASSVLRFSIESTLDSNKILFYGIEILLLGTAFLCGVSVIVYVIKVITWPVSNYILLIFLFFFMALNEILTNYLRATDRIKSVAIAGILVTVGTIFSNMILLLLFKFEVQGYICSIIIGNALSCVYCFCLIGFKFVKERCPAELKKEMRKYSIPLIFNGVAWWLNGSLDKYFVIWILGASYNGLLAVANKIPTILSVFQNIFSQAWNLSAIKEFDKDDRDGFFSKTYTLYNVALTTICSCLILINVPLARLLFAKDFFQAWSYSSTLLLSGLFSSLSSFCGSIFTAVKKSKIFATSTVFSAIVNIILNSILIPLWGVQGAVIATAVSFFCIWAIRLKCTYNCINWKINVQRDFIVYILLILQVFLEHSESHMYIGQVMVLVCIIILYQKSLKQISHMVFSNFKIEKIR